jgi:tetratricopeptide (TPR) repeat protein
LLVAFAGHGIERDDRAFLMPSDARVSGDVELLEESAISLARHVHDWIRSKHVGQVVILLDACRTDPTASRSIRPNRLTPAYTEGLSFDVVNHEVEAFATIYATGRDQQAFENTRKRQGFFMEAVVEGIKGAAANTRGLVTLGGLLDYLEKTVPKRVAIEIGADKEQRPWADIKGYRPYELVISSAPHSTPVMPVTADQYAKKGQSLFQQERWAEAEMQYREALRLDPNRAQYHFDLAEAMVRQEKTLDAESEYRRALLVESNHADWHIGLGVVLQDQKRWQDAENEFRDAIRLAPNDAICRTYLAHLLAQLQRWAAAEVEYSKAASLEPERTALHYNLAVTLLEQQKWVRAEEEAKESVRRDPGNVRYQELLKRIRDAAAAQPSSSATDTTELTPKVRNENASALQHKQAGDKFSKEKQWRGAENEYRQAVEIEPNQPQWRNDLANALFNLQKWVEADSQLREALRLDPNYVQSHANLGLLLLREGRWVDAEKEFREAIRLQPATAIWQGYVGASLMGQKKYSKAETAFSEAVRLEPSKADWYYQLGRSHHERERWKEAEEQFNMAVRLDPKKAIYRFYLGYALSKRSKWQEGIEVLRAAIGLDPNNAAMRGNLAIILTNVKRWGEAEIEIREAMRLDATSSKYPDLLRRIQKKDVLLP